MKAVRRAWRQSGLTVLQAVQIIAVIALVGGLAVAYEATPLDDWLDSCAPTGTCFD